MARRAEQRVHILGIRHHGPGSAALLCKALDTLDPACVLVEGPPEGDALLPFMLDADLRPPVAMLVYAPEEPELATFFPFAEFSPEWQAIRWALRRGRPVQFCDWPAAVSIAVSREQPEDAARDAQPDALDLLADAAGYEDGETFWNGLIEQHGGDGQQALAVFASIASAMTEARAAESPEHARRHLLREAFMRTHIRAKLREHDGAIAVVTGAWHVSGLRAETTAAEDRALIKDLPRVKVEATWVPWTDSQLSAAAGYGAGVVSPGWYRHLWTLYQRALPASAEEFTSMWQARTAYLLREEGYGAATASAIEATRLALGLASLREIPFPGLAEMREAALASMCNGNPVPLAVVERKLYIGESVGEIGDRVPQNPLARDFSIWLRKTRMKPQDLQQEMKLDLRTEAGLLKSTLLHRLNLIQVPWGKLMDAQAGRGTFREVWTLEWQPFYSVALAQAVIHGVTIEQAAANATVQRARAATAVQTLAGLVQGALIADLPEAASTCIGLLQAASVAAVDLTDLMNAAAPLAHVLRYGTARRLPEEELRALIHSICVEVNAGIRIGSRGLDEQATAARVVAMDAYDGAVRLLDDAALAEAWLQALETMIEDDKVSPAVAGISLRRLHDGRQWDEGRVAGAFARHTGAREPKESGAFLEGFLRGGAEVMLQDEALLQLLDNWVSELNETDFTDSLPLLRRSLSQLDTIARRRFLEKLVRGPKRENRSETSGSGEISPAFEAALPLLYKILGVGEAG